MKFIEAFLLFLHDTNSLWFLYIYVKPRQAGEGSPIQGVICLYSRWQALFRNGAVMVPPLGRWAIGEMADNSGDVTDQIMIMVMLSGKKASRGAMKIEYITRVPHVNILIFLGKSTIGLSGKMSHT